MNAITSNLSKVKDIFRSPALRAIVQWSQPAHLSIVLISMIAVVGSLNSLGVTLVTKALIDGATGGNVSALWTYGAALVALIALSRGLSVLSAYIGTKTSAALTGISGGGKTSLFQLLLGIYKPKEGAVLFRQGGVTVPASRDTRSLFAYVPQGNTLMSGTLKDNLTMFTDHAAEEDINAAIHAACLDDLVAEVGMDAKLGERGIGLSEGQAQRVAVARALLSKAPILLLDESTSALDEKTEAKLLENIDAMRDKTVIIVTHRHAALSICDYTLHIEGGSMTRIEGTAQ